MMRHIRDRWLSSFLFFSGQVFGLKQKTVKAKTWSGAAYYAMVLVLSEILFFLISLPLYILVPPVKLQEKGTIFPESGQDATGLPGYTMRRKISIVTISGVFLIWIIKLAFVGASSFYLLGLQPLLAEGLDWTFDSSSDYVFDASKIAVSGGAATLVDQGTGGNCSGSSTACSAFSSSATCAAQSGCSWGGSASGATTNSTFDSNSTGWTYVDWETGTRAAGTRISFGGNPNGYINITLQSQNNRTISGYWQQPFTTTASNPTGSLTFDWRITNFSSSGLTSYKIYVFVDSAAGAPTIGNEVWSQTITSATSWARVSNLDVSSKITTAGTYYLKLVARRITGAASGGDEIVGFDNVALNWQKAAACSGTPVACNTRATSALCSVVAGCSWTNVPVYPSSRPSISPTNSLVAPGVTYWNSFTETATKNGGEIYYQLSSDDGTTWKYWNGLAWAVAATTTNSNTATAVSSNIRTFDASSGKIKWKAYLASNGSQQISLDNVSVNYLQNSAPVIQNLTASQDVQHGYVVINYNLADAQSDPSSLVNYEYSLTGAFVGEQVTMTPVVGDPAHSGVAGLTSSPAGTAHSFVWDALADLGNVYTGTVFVRLRPNDGITNGDFASSAAFAVDGAAPVISGLSAVQATGTTDIAISYNLFDNTADTISVELQVSADGGQTWNVPASSLSGDIGETVSAGSGKIITWQAGTDYSGHEVNDMRVRVRAKDKYQNQSAYFFSANFILDNAPPVVATQADIKTQPMAGATAVLVGGSFTDKNPNINNFFVAIDNGAYGSAVSGDTNTATPSDKNVEVGRALKGNDFVSAVKIEHTDDFGQTSVNENLAPNPSYKFVKPFTPLPPTVNNETENSIDVTINRNPDEADGLDYAIFEATQSKYVQRDGSFGPEPDWMGMGKVKVKDVSQPISQYIFKVKSRNINDPDHAALSESEYSSGASSNYQSPQVAINSAAQATDGSKTVVINYTGTDFNNQANNLVTYEYSQDGATWHTMTEKTGAPSNGTTNLAFNASGANLTFVWNVNADLPNTEDSSVSVRFVSNDTISNSNTAVSAPFAVNTAGPVVSSVQAVQLNNTDDVEIRYNLVEDSGEGNLVEILVSNNAGESWDVAATNLTGDIGTGVMAGEGRIIHWNVGADLPGLEKSDMRVKIRAKDSFGNQGDYAQSENFKVDTKAPAISGVTAEQSSGSALVTVNYTLSDLSSCQVLFDVSSDSGATWSVATATYSGDIGSDQVSGSKTFTWNVVVDMPGRESNAMRIRVAAIDSFSHVGAYASSEDFSVNTQALSISDISAAQNSNTKTVTIRYDLNKTATIAMDISSDGGLTWTVATTTLSGNIGPSVSAGHNKSIAWNPGVDFNGQENSNIRARLWGIESSGAVSDYYESMDFSVDTKAPAGLTLFRKYSSTADSVTLNWSSGVHDAHFNHYEIWHGSVQNDVATRSGTATKWSTSQDSALSSVDAISTVITGLDLSHDYYAKIWAVDDYGNESELDEINVYVPPAPTYNLIIQESEGEGTTDPAVGTHAYNENSLIQVSASPAVDWLFDHWLLDVSSTISTNPLTVVMDKDHDLKAVFKSAPPTPPTPTTTPSEVVQTPVSGGGSSQTIVAVNPNKPVLTSLETPTKNTRVLISGIADPASNVDLYDNGSFILTFDKKADENGQFSQTIALSVGQHSLTAKARDAIENSSQFSDPVVLDIVITPPATPIILSPTSGQGTTDSTPLIVGVADPNMKLNLLLDGKIELNTNSDSKGSWQIKIPSTYSLSEGPHTLKVSGEDAAGNKSQEANLAFNKVTQVVPKAVESPKAQPGQQEQPVRQVAATRPVPVSVSARTVQSIPTPPVSLVRETTEAVALPGVPAPRVASADSAVSGNDITFTGTALPNQDVVVYLHSEQALAYRTRADAKGIWTILHSQDLTQLEPGEHTIFAVAVDPNSGVKSLPGPVNTFTVHMNWWAYAFRRLNWPTSIATFIILALALYWLNRVKRTNKRRV